MTGNSDLRERLGAVFFAFIMVTSMVAVGMAGFAGSAAADSPPDIEIDTKQFVNGSATQSLGTSSNPLNISEGTNSFGSSGSGSVVLPNGFSFNQSSSDLAVRQVNNGSVSNVQFTNSQTLEFDYTTSSGRTDIQFASISVDVAPSATNGDLTATVGIGENTVALSTFAASLDDDGSDAQMPRGASGHQTRHRLATRRRC